MDNSTELTDRLRDYLSERPDIEWCPYVDWADMNALIVEGMSSGSDKLEQIRERDRLLRETSAPYIIWHLTDESILKLANAAIRDRAYLLSLLPQALPAPPSRNAEGGE